MRRALAVCVGSIALAGCPSPREYDNPPDVPLPPTATPSASAPATPAAPAAAGYFRTESSDAWVAHNFKLQSAYARVLLVGEPKAKSIEVAPPSLGPGSVGKKLHSVDAHFATIQEAIGASKPGDLVAVQPGQYAGFVIGPVEGAGDGAYTFVRALGPPGAVVIDRQSLDASWMIYARTAHHVVIEGFHIKGTSDGKGPRAGIMLDGDFGRTGKLLRNVAVVGVLSFGHKTWGLHSTDTATVLIQDSAFGGSILEHGLYASDGSDDWVIRRNVFFDNYAGGLQINLDPLASLEETIRHIGMMGAPPEAGTRAWAVDTLARATRTYGENNFPDGRGINFIVEDNVATNNGKKGGAAFNFAVICESLIQNNLAYGNYAGGLVLWDNKNPYDNELTDDPPTSPAEWVPDKKPLFGSRDNLVRNNTFFNEASPRAAIQVRHGSFGNRFFSNVALHGTGPGMWVTPDSLERLEARGNVMGSIQTDGASPEMLKLATLMPAQGSTVNVAFDDVKRAMVAPSLERWIVLEGGWWKAAPKRPDFRPKEPGGFFKPGGPAAIVPLDQAGRKRGADIPGAFAP
ncbi:MAG: right-handed parallel beta-helix repeat-containing protein [Polyangiaceae bacterium]|nr:right-handed parallel beta-helix repeat-containing protein [Polyangiaceae bacterium]